MTKIDHKIVDVAFGGRTAALLCVRDNVPLCDCIGQVINVYGFTDVSEYVESYPGKFSPGSLVVKCNPYFKGSRSRLRRLKKCHNSCFYEYAQSSLIINADMIYGYDVFEELGSCSVYPFVEEIKRSQAYNETKDERFLYVGEDWDEGKWTSRLKNICSALRAWLGRFLC